MALIGILKLPPAPADSPMFGFQTMNQAINLHKILCGPVILGMMTYYENFTLITWLYLAIHSAYGLLWLIKYATFSDRSFNMYISKPLFLFSFFASTLYWYIPYMLISDPIASSPQSIPPYRPAIALFLYTFGIFLHYTSDCQKYFTLKYRRGLITEGLFAKSRNMNYVGEVLIYSGFAVLSGHNFAWIVNSVFWFGLFLPSMLSKDKSLSKYEQFKNYKETSGLFFPRFI
jgi:protein-S-isoprenylcysteine O-methyltransferase Ste14